MTTVDAGSKAAGPVTIVHRTPRVELILHTRVMSEALGFKLALENVPTYAVEVLIVHINTSSRHDEIIGHRLSLTVMDTVGVAEAIAAVNAAENTDGDEYKFSFRHVATDGVLRVTAADLSPLFVYPAAEIVRLAPGEELVAEAIVMRGTSAEHSKWCPVVAMHFQQHQDGFKFEFELTGALPLDLLISEALTIARTVDDYPGTTLFTVPRVSRLSI
jgi:hypothetical protein